MDLLYCVAALVFLYLLNRYFSGPSFNTKNLCLVGRNAVITGGNTGIGKQVLLQLVRLGCNVIIGARDKEKCQQAIYQALVQRRKHHKQKSQQIKIEYFELDLSSKKSIQEFAQSISFQTIDFLVNNAGIMSLPIKKLNQAGLEMHYAVNHLGHFYLTYLLIGKLQKSSFFKIINVSSLAHKKVMGFFFHFDLDFENLNYTKQNTYDKDLAYSRSKLYNVLFTKALSNKIDKSKGIAVCLHPGVVRTQITRHLKLLDKLIVILYPIYCIFTKSSNQGAQTVLFCLLSNSEDIQSGGYYADCRRSKQNDLALIEQNYNRLWQISEKDLNVKFQIKKEPTQKNAK